MSLLHKSYFSRNGRISSAASSGRSSCGQWPTSGSIDTKTLSRSAATLLKYFDICQRCCQTTEFRQKSLHHNHSLNMAFESLRYYENKTAFKFLVWTAQYSVATNSNQNIPGKYYLLVHLPESRDPVHPTAIVEVRRSGAPTPPVVALWTQANQWL